MPDDLINMTVHDRRIWGRGILQQAWQSYYNEEPTLAALETAQGMTEGEGWYGFASKPAAWQGSNNWGGITCTGTCDDSNSFTSGDHLADGTQYQTRFKKYPTPLDGAIDFIKYIGDNYGGHDLAMSGDLVGFATQLRSKGYYQGDSTDPTQAAQDYAQAIYTRVVGNPTSGDPGIASDVEDGGVFVSMSGPVDDAGTPPTLPTGTRSLFIGLGVLAIAAIATWQFDGLAVAEKAADDLDAWLKGIFS